MTSRPPWPTRRHPLLQDAFALALAEASARLLPEHPEALVAARHTYAQWRAGLGDLLPDPYPITLRTWEALLHADNVAAIR